MKKLSMIELKALSEIIQNEASKEIKKGMERRKNAPERIQLAEYDLKNLEKLSSFLKNDIGEYSANRLLSLYSEDDTPDKELKSPQNILQELILNNSKEWASMEDLKKSINPFE